MNKNWNPDMIKQLLNRSLAQLDQPIVAQLRDARMLALNRHETRSATVPLFAWAGGHIIRHPSAHLHRSYYWIGVLLLAASLLSSVTFMQQTMDNDTSDEDIAILTDELPIQFYVE